jgi:NlpC/P60 family putative phage cell wall peptidase
MMGALGSVKRAQIVAAARSWIGTPYQHQASLKGVGCDCLGLLRGVWRDLYEIEPPAPPPYRADWAELGTNEALLSAVTEHFVRVPDGAVPLSGDLLLFRMAPEALTKHCAIVSEDCGGADYGRIIHTYWGRAAVESWLGPWWQRRLSAHFSFPNLRD